MAKQQEESLSDDDFMTPTRRRHIRVAEGTTRPVDRLHATISRAHHFLSQARVRGSDHQPSSIMEEVSSRFPQTAISHKRSKRKKCWNVIPVCLRTHRESRVPTKGKLANLCLLGLGSKWFCNEDKLAIELQFTAQEVHFLIVCLYPQLRDVPYELCKAAGPGNCVIVPLIINDPSKKARLGQPFIPPFSCVKVKELIGRKGKLYIRSLESIPNIVCPTLTDLEVYTHQEELRCFQCDTMLSMTLIPSHIHLCEGVPLVMNDSAGPSNSLLNESQSASITIPTSGSVSAAVDIPRSSSNSGNVTATVIAPSSSFSRGNVTATVIAPSSSFSTGNVRERVSAPSSSFSGGDVTASVIAPSSSFRSGNVRARVSAPRSSFSGGDVTASVSAPSSSFSGGDVTASVSAPSSSFSGGGVTASVSAPSSSFSGGDVTASVSAPSSSFNSENVYYNSADSMYHGPGRIESLDETREILRQQDEAYAESLRIDQERGRQRMLEDEEKVERERRRMQLEAWYDRIRNDHSQMVQEEPPVGLQGTVQLRFRLPDGERVSRRFLQTDDVQGVYSFVGSLSSINPRQYRLLVSDVPQPRVLPKEGTLLTAGIAVFSLIIVENTMQNIEDELDALQHSVHETTRPLDMHFEPIEVGEDTFSVSENIPDYEAYVEQNDQSLHINSLEQLEERRRSIRLTLTCTGTKHIEVDRNNIVEDVLALYTEDPGIVNMELVVTFRNERGFDGGGLHRELFPIFWHAVEQRMMEGNAEKVPILTPRSAKYFYTLGLILSHGYVLTGFVPMCFASPFFLGLINDQSVTPDDILLQSFLNYIDPRERVAVEACISANDISDTSAVLENVIIPMLARFNCDVIPKKENIREVVLHTAEYALVCQPYYAIVQIRRGMLCANPSLWRHCALAVGIELCHSLLPTNMKVWNMVEEPVYRNSTESRCFDYLRRFIFTLSTESLSLLLRFVTGSPHCVNQTVSVDFFVPSSSFVRRPTATTCGMVLHLPSTYESFSQFSQEFEEILRSSHLWSFDIV